MCTSMSVRPDGSVDVLPGILVQVDIRVECGTGPKQGLLVACRRSAGVSCNVVDSHEWKG